MQPISTTLPGKPNTPYPKPRVVIGPPTITAQCKAAFDTLIEKMWFIKSCYFLSPPLTDADFISLELKPKDTARTPIPAPTDQTEADISRPGVHLLELYLRPIAGFLPDPHRSDYGFRIYWGILPPAAQIQWRQRG
jgi:hypothetical protein